MALIVVARDRRDVARARRRAGAEGRPDDHHLRAAARVVLLLPVRGPAGDQAAGAGPAGDDRDPDDRAWSCCSSCRSTTAARSARPERRPVATTAVVLTIVAMAYLTYLGANAGSPTEIDLTVPPQYEAGQGGRRAVGLPRVPQARRQRQRRPGPELTHIGARIPRAAILRSLVAGPSIMPSFRASARRSSTRSPTSSHR